ncbi:hypothetical protein [Lederbergia sp. NSJ-179]|nr:hypothetical protein [Lederbergia sp. NSJ-179]
MNCKEERALYHEQLENEIVGMEATIERLRSEIHELIEIKNA